jgi:hypothetical protein
LELAGDEVGGDRLLEVLAEVGAHIAGIFAGEDRQEPVELGADR